MEPVGITGRDALMAEIRSAKSKPKAKRNTSSQSPQSTSASTQAEHEQNSTTGETAVAPKVQLAASGNPRDSLLASIREAAGKPRQKPGASARGRRLEERKEQLKQEAAGVDKKSGADGMDLMSDLVNKLRARRDGISGSFADNPPTSKAISAQKSLNPTAPREAPLPADTLQRRVMNQVSSIIPVLHADSSSEGGDETKSNDFEEDEWKD